MAAISRYALDEGEAGQEEVDVEVLLVEAVVSWQGLLVVQHPPEGRHLEQLAGLLDVAGHDLAPEGVPQLQGVLRTPARAPASSCLMLCSLSSIVRGTHALSVQALLPLMCTQAPPALSRGQISHQEGSSHPKVLRGSCILDGLQESPTAQHDS